MVLDHGPWNVFGYPYWIMDYDYYTMVAQRVFLFKVLLESVVKD